ncbi:hypothetical protein K0M31_001249 [Melipona bicolor]|uniref:Uncharacterized protein n=1 Tax=Melipona bicolor TaxID=60889 RepID=A0AA40GF41_9HYME|nr:hypothetical protein K0M31_001249 [Melipona bicolor]
MYMVGLICRLEGKKSKCKGAIPLQLLKKDTNHELLRSPQLNRPALSDAVELAAFQHRPLLAARM